jgi:uncharacterized protein
MRGYWKVVGVWLVAFALAGSHGHATGLKPSQVNAAVKRSVAPVIPLTGRVTDAAHILTPRQVASLSTRLERLERATGHQLVVATVPTLHGADIAAVARDLGNSWGIGRKGFDDGVVVLVAPNERKVRIAVGYGLERRLTPGLCQQIIDQQMLPRFRQGDLPAGIEAGVKAVIARLK